MIKQGASGMFAVKLHLRLEIYLVLMFELFISSDEYIGVKVETGASSTVCPNLCTRSNSMDEMSSPDFALIHVIKPDFTLMLDEASAMPVL